MTLLCKIFGHKWHSSWAGGRSGYFGAIVVNIHNCERCDETVYEYSTSVEIKGGLIDRLEREKEART